MPSVPSPPASGAAFPFVSSSVRLPMRIDRWETGTAGPSVSAVLCAGAGSASATQSKSRKRRAIFPEGMAECNVDLTAKLDGGPALLRAACEAIPDQPVLLARALLAPLARRLPGVGAHQPRQVALVGEAMRRGNVCEGTI